MAGLYIRVVYYTTRWQRLGQQHVGGVIGEDKPFIYALWHSRLLMMPCFNKAHILPTYVVISHHGDGDLIANLLGFFGIHAIRGSSSRGAQGAMKNIFKELKAGHVVTITPDGPRGPKEKVQGNIIAIAAKFGVPIVPVVYSTRLCKRLGSWDRFMIPFPFGRGVFIYGKPVVVSGQDNKKEKQNELERELDSITRKADEMSV